MRPQPGSQLFEERLLERLRADVRIENAHELRIQSVKTTSRNTLIYRIVGGGHRLIGKVQITKPAWVVTAEYYMLRELINRLCVDGIRSLYPVTLYPELGVLITREEAGIPLRSFIDYGIRAAPWSPIRQHAETLIARAAVGLCAFHTAFGIRKGDEGFEIARRYLDYSPRNVLVASNSINDAELILIDPPELVEEGAVHLDIGTFCFDISRAGFMPQSLFRFKSAQLWLDSLKWRFITSYFNCLGRRVTSSDLIAIRDAEVQRAQQALQWYARFFIYRRWMVEFARFLYFSPFILWYITSYLRHSYRRFHSWLQKTALCASH